MALHYLTNIIDNKNLDFNNIVKRGIGIYTGYKSPLSVTNGRNITKLSNGFWNLHSNFLNNWLLLDAKFDLDKYISDSKNSIDAWSNIGGHLYYNYQDKSKLFTSKEIENFLKGFEGTEFGAAFNREMLNARAGGNWDFSGGASGISNDRIINGETKFDSYHGALNLQRVYGLHKDSTQEDFLKWALYMKSKGAKGAYIYKDFWMPVKNTNEADPNSEFVDFIDLNPTISTKAQTPPYDGLNRGVLTPKENSILSGGLPEDIKEIQPLKSNNNLLKYLPDAIATGRLALALRNNKLVHDIYNKSLHPVLKNTYERYSPVVGDFAAMQAKNLQAASLQSQAAIPITSDASLQSARLFEAQRQANLLRTEGFLADNLRIRETAKEALARQEDNMARRSDVANYNRLQILNVIEKRAENDALTKKANWQSIDLYAQGWEKRFRYDNEKKKLDLEKWNDIIISQNAEKYYDILNKKILDRIAYLLTKHGNSLMTSWPEWESIKDDLMLLERYKTDYLYLLKAQLEGINYPGLYTKLQRNSWNPTPFKSGGKFTPKLLQGGSIANSLAVYQDISGQFYDLMLAAEAKAAKASSGSSKKSDKESKEDNFSKKDLINILKSAEFLPNDVRLLTNLISNIFAMASVTGRDISDLSSQYMQLYPYLNNAQVAKKQYDEIVKQVKQDDRINDLAYYRGKVFATDSETGKVVSLTKLLLDSNKERFLPMTYGNLLWLAKEMPDLAFDHSYLEAASNGIGLNLILKLIKDRILKLGSEKLVQEYYGLNSQLVKGLENLLRLTAAGPLGYYKMREELETNNSAIANALSYVINTLPEDVIGRLSYQTPNGTLEEVIELIKRMLLGGLEITQSYTLSTVATSEDGTLTRKSSKSSSSDDTKEGFYSLMLLGKGGDDKTYKLLIDSGKETVDGKYYARIPDLNHDMALGDLLTTNLGSISKNNKAISFGNIKIDDLSLNHVMVNPTGGSIVAVLPKNPDDSINFNLLNIYLEIQNKLKEEGYTLNSDKYNQELKSRMDKETGYGFMFNSDGTPNKLFFGLFLVLEGLTSGNTIGYDKDNKKVSIDDIESNYVIKHESDRLLLDKLELGLSTKARGAYKLGDKYSWGNPFDWGGNSDVIYEGNIYIPLTENIINAYNADKNDLKSNQAKLFEEYYLYRDKLDIANANNEI